ncbi:hypothetical protein Tco_1418419 [Tanacetum coccineum]
MPPANNGSTKDVQPPVVQIQSRNLNPEPNVSPDDTPIPKASIPFPSRRNDENRRDILLLEAFLNNEHRLLFQIKEILVKVSPETKKKSILVDAPKLLNLQIDGTARVELKDLPSHLEYASWKMGNSSYSHHF